MEHAARIESVMGAALASAVGSELVAAKSKLSINFIGSSGMHADFGKGTYEGHIIGIPYMVVPDTQPVATIDVTEYPEESDPEPMPIPSNAPIEGDLPSSFIPREQRHIR